MKMMYLGAASLMALGMAACGENAGTRYAEEDQDETSAYENETERRANEDQTPDRQAGAAGESRDTAMTADEPGADEMGGETDLAEEPSMGQEPTGAGRAATMQPISMSIAEVETEEDLSQLLDSSFQRADVDQNGQLSREEFQILTASLAPADGAQTPGGTTQDQTGPEAQGDAAPGAESAQVRAEEEIFAEAAGAADAVEKESLREAFLARFKTADADNDDRLDPQEREEFVRIALGGGGQTQSPGLDQNQ